MARGYYTGLKQNPRLRRTRRPQMSHIYWAAGIYEGEGTCSSGSGGVACAVTQKDPWILYRLKERFGGSVSKKIQTHGKFHHHRWLVCGARARGFLFTIFSLMSPRRRTQIRKALETKDLPNGL